MPSYTKTYKNNVSPFSECNKQSRPWSLLTYTRPERSLPLDRCTFINRHEQIVGLFVDEAAVPNIQHFLSDLKIEWKKPYNLWWKRRYSALAHPYTANNIIQMKPQNHSN
ncbi:hypothetical protein CHUAL_004756 [Chamberlinius hualienensis]